MRHRSLRLRATAALGCASLLLGGLWQALPAHADLYGAMGEYKKGNYPDAFNEFLALAKLGQPMAQLTVARLYVLGQGVRQNYIEAYAWASLASQNGEADGKKIADAIAPVLPPGSKPVIEEITAPYTPEALDRTLLPQLLTAQAAQQHWQAMKQPPCWPVKVFDPGPPPNAAMNKDQGRVLVEYTLMPDGTTRLPRVLYAYPAGIFDATTREAVLRSQFAPRTGAAPMQCVEWDEYTLKGGFGSGVTMAGTGAVDFSHGGGMGGMGGMSSMGGMGGAGGMGGMGGRGTVYIQSDDVLRSSYAELDRQYRNLKRDADRGNDPTAELYFGLLIEGAPQLGEAPTAGLSWMVKAAQAGLPMAQFEVGYRLLTGLDCQADTPKAMKWLHLAGTQHETTADVILATRLLSGTPDAAATAEAQERLEQAVAGGNEYGELYLSALLAASPDPKVRDPKRALLLLDRIYVGVQDDPTAGEIRAAAQAASGDFPDAIRSEQGAIAAAHNLGWDLAPLEQRLAAYRSQKPWYGPLLAF